MKDKKKKAKRKLGLLQKILLGVLGVVVLAVLIWFAYYMFHYYLYDDYKQYLNGYETEMGTDFHSLKDSSKDVDNMELVAENGNLKLYASPESGNVAVYDKRSGVTTYSNPVNADEDPIANNTNKNYLKSQFVINYYNAAKAMGTYDSYSMAVEKGQLQAQSIDNGVRFIYTLGDFSTNTTGIVPLYLDKNKLEEICGKIDETAQTNMRRYYSTEDDKTGMLVLNGVAQKNVKTIKKITGYLEEAGFTEEDYEAQMELAGIEVALPLSFTIALEYRLSDDSIEVSVPSSMIEENGGGKLYRIRLLGYFGAAGADDEGYLVVPNGSGSLIYFNNGKSNVENYSQYIYDIDPLAADYTLLENTQKVRLPICGICKEDSDILMSVEDGATTAFFTASVAGSNTSYNYVNTTFVVRGYDLLSMFGSTGNEADLPLLEKDMYDINYKVRYTFLDDEHKGYSGIANYYRERLINEGVLNEKTASGDIPFYYDIIGGVKETASFVGIRYLKVMAMTTYEEASDIALELKDKGIVYQVMNLQGWSNGGYYADVYDKITGLGKLGGKKDLESLNDTMESIGGRLYVDVPFQGVTSISKRYSGSFETSRYYGAGYVARFGAHNPATLRITSSLGYDENIYDLISPKFLKRYVDAFIKKFSRLDVGGIGLRDLGDEVHSDKKRTEFINREEALDIVKAQLDKLAGTGKNILINGGNDYSFKYATDIIDVPLRDNEFRIIDEEIPLYEMIIHGYINYAGGQLNFHDSADNTEITLRMIEYGASPRYVFTKESASEMKYTALNKFYATKYDNWCDEAVSVYNKVNEILKYVSGETVVKHEIRDSGVRAVTYSNGVVIYVNYTDYDVVEDGITIPAHGYQKGGK